MPVRWIQVVLTLALVEAAGFRAGGALVDLELQPAHQQVGMGDVVEIQIVARAPTPQCINGIDAIIAWDPNVLTLTGHDQTDAGYVWLTAGFLNDPDDINDDLSDGDGLFTALAFPGNPAFADPNGLVVTTLRFEPVALSSGTVVRFLSQLGQFGHTRVLCGGNITGDISSTAIVEVFPCPGPCPADIDDSGLVDQSDLGILLSAFGKCDGQPGFDPLADLDCSDCIDQSDLGILLSFFGQPCD